MIKEFSRSLRLRELIKRELAIIIQSEFDTLPFGIVTLNTVNVSKDLSIADIYFTVMSDCSDKLSIDSTRIESKSEEAFSWLKKMSPFLRKRLSKNLQIRRVPILRFKFDKTLLKAESINKILMSKEPLREMVN